MFTIRFDTINFRPDLTVTIRTNVKGWDNDIAGEYIDDSWQFELYEVEFPSGLQFKFVLENIYWMDGVNLFVQPIAGQIYIFSDTAITFPPMQEVLVENPFVSQMFFKPNLNEAKIYDAVIIGSGIGGGILADQLSDLNLDVLVLEAGSYLFPSHIANLPRQHQIGQFDKHVWGLWDEFQVLNYINTPTSQYKGAQGFNLGDRSIFWGGLIPRMQNYEMDLWPKPIKWYLEDSGYQSAEDLMNRSPQLPSPYHQFIKREIRNFLPDYNNFDAPVAVQYNNGNLGTIPVGMFSTADLLMESRLTVNAKGQEKLTVNLNHAVTGLIKQNDEITGVTVYDLIARKNRVYKGKKVVLCAGTVESAKLALLSQLDNPSGKIGVGITDHPIFFTHFAIPVGSPFYSALDNSKILLQHKKANDTPSVHPYNVVIELGADFNQGRYVDDDLLAEHLKLRGNTMLGEIVFLLNSPLEDTNFLTQNGTSAVKPVVQMQATQVALNIFNEINNLKNEILAKLGAIPLANNNLDLKLANLGGVAHEVGTLRLGEDAASSVVDLNLKFHNYKNLYVCDLSVFPSSPAANPTLTLAALAIRLAEHLKEVG